MFTRPIHQPTTAEQANGVRGYLNIPIIQDKVSLRISAFDRDDPGFMSNVTLGTNETNKTTVSGGRIALRIQPIENLNILFSGFIQDLRSDGSTQVDTDAATLKPIYCNYCYAAPLDPLFETQYRTAGMVLNWTVPAGTLTNSLSYGKYQDAETFDYTREYGVLFRVSRRRTMPSLVLCIHPCARSPKSCDLRPRDSATGKDWGGYSSPTKTINTTSRSRMRSHHH